jgi:hypothetical protein
MPNPKGINKAAVRGLKHRNLEVEQGGGSEWMMGRSLWLLFSMLLCKSDVSMEDLGGMLHMTSMRQISVSGILSTLNSQYIKSSLVCTTTLLPNVAHDLIVGTILAICEKLVLVSFPFFCVVNFCIQVNFVHHPVANSLVFQDFQKEKEI